MENSENNYYYQADDIFEKYFKFITSYCFTELGSWHEAEDCAMEVFTVFLKKARDIDPAVNIEIWLMKTAKNKIMNLKNLKRCKDSLFDDEPVLKEFSEECTFDKGKYELLEDILSEEEIELLERYYLSGKKTDEVAEENNISSGALRKRISNIKKKLKEGLNIK